MDKNLKELDEKISVLDPKMKNQIEKLFSTMSESISMLYDIATHDEKTGLYNNKFFENMLDIEIEKAKRGQQELSLMIIDIDFFKKINDTYGHVKADDLLAQLAKVLKKHIRKSDIAARFGGEEFFILFPETNLKKTKALISRIKNSIKSDNVLKKYGITVSGGVTQYKKRDTKKSFKKRVDNALYKAKKTGRDKFVFI